MLVLSAGIKENISFKYNLKTYQNKKQIIANNTNYLANLIILEIWYKNVRRLFISEDFSKATRSNVMR